MYTKSNNVSPEESNLMLFHLSHCSLTGMDDLPGSPPAVPGVGSGKRMIKLLKGDNLMISMIHNLRGESLIKGSWGTGKTLHICRMLLNLSSGFSISEITIHSYYNF